MPFSWSKSGAAVSAVATAALTALNRVVEQAGQQQQGVCDWV